VPSYFKRSLPPAGFSLVNASYAAYARDGSLNKTEKRFALTMNNVFKYNQGTTVGITKDISKYIQLFYTFDYLKGYFQTRTCTFPPKDVFKWCPAYWQLP